MSRESPDIRDYGFRRDRRTVHRVLAETSTNVREGEPGWHYIASAELRRTPLRIALSPIPSLAGALRDAVGADQNGTPERWCRAIRTHLDRRDYETWAPFITCPATLIPDPLLGLVGPPGESLQIGIERMMATPIDAPALAGREVTERNPRAWLARYVGSLLRAWKGFGPVWRQAQPALDREAERVGLATVMDSQLGLLDRLLPFATVLDGGLGIRCEMSSSRAYLPDDGLVLMPVVGGHRTKIIVRNDDVIETIGYAVPLPAASPTAGPAPGALDSLVGLPRAQVLRRLTAATSIGRLAQLLRAVPSAATHHVDAPEAAGLVERERVGRHVLVRRTALGERLLALYGEGFVNSPQARPPVAGARRRRRTPTGERPMRSDPCPQ